MRPPALFMACRLAALAFFVPLAAPAQARWLNDTGITWSANGTDTAAVCDASHPAGQDCRQGRDKDAADGELAKTGGSTLNEGVANGFDYTKISNSGNPLPASAALGTGADDWACTRDNVSGLIWEVKTTSGLRNQNHTYTWYDPNSPDGYWGTDNGGTCETSGRCDTQKYVQDVNTATLCGASDWRMPTAKELFGINDLGRFPISQTFDPGYFPNSNTSYVYWSGQPYAGGNQDEAWVTVLNMGLMVTTGRYNAGAVRLVRHGQ